MSDGHTINDLIAKNMELRVNCGICSHGHNVDLPALAERIGGDHGAMHDDLQPLFTCERCKAKGEKRRDVFFTVIPDYSRWAGRLNTDEILPKDRGGG